MSARPPSFGVRAGILGFGDFVWGWGVGSMVYALGHGVQGRGAGFENLGFGARGFWLPVASFILLHPVGHGFNV